MALRNIIAPVAALLLASAINVTPATAAPVVDAATAAARLSHGGGNAKIGGGVHSGRHASGGHRSRSGRSHFRGRRYGRSYGGGVVVLPWGLFGAFGAPYPYYAGPDEVVCRYRWVRRHGRLVRRRYCWRDDW